MSVVLDGGATEPLLAAFLVALKIKGETSAELAGFARAMRERSIFVDCGADVIDTCGTGGSGDGTFNISTIAAMVMAGAGARVAKHGNRSISSVSAGSAEVVEALGIKFAMTPEEAARAQRQLIGAPSAKVARLMADALCELGTERSFVVHGYNGLDEISTTGPTHVFEVREGRVTEHTWSPADFGVACATLEQLRGGDAASNAAIAVAVLGGDLGPARDIVLINAAAGLVAAGIAADLGEGMARAQRSIQSGAAFDRLHALRGMFPIDEASPARHGGIRS